MISNFIKQIIELDKNANSELESIDKEVEEIKDNSLKKITEAEKTVLVDFRNSLQQEYDSRILEAQFEYDRAVDESKVECLDLKKRYESIKDETAREILEALFSAEV